MNRPSFPSVVVSSADELREVATHFARTSRLEPLALISAFDVYTGDVARRVGQPLEMTPPATARAAAIEQMISDHEDLSDPYPAHVRVSLENQGMLFLAMPLSIITIDEWRRDVEDAEERKRAPTLSPLTLQ